MLWNCSLHVLLTRTPARLHNDICDMRLVSGMPIPFPISTCQLQCVRAGYGCTCRCNVDFESIREKLRAAQFSRVSARETRQTDTGTICDAISQMNRKCWLKLQQIVEDPVTQEKITTSSRDAPMADVWENWTLRNIRVQFTSLD